MKINRFIALAAIALLVVGAMGLLASRTFALESNGRVAQTSSCPNDKPDGAELQGAPDTDKVDLECGSQDAVDEQESADESDATDAQDAGESETVDEQDAAPTGTPSITADQAKQAAISAHAGTVLKAELEEDNGHLVYSVKFANDVDVKVDAMTGKVLGIETGKD